MTDVENPSGPPPVRIDDLLCNVSLEAKEVEVAAGVMYDAASPARDLYYIRSGQVRVFQPGRDNSVRLVEILGPGDWFGVQALAGSPTYGAKAVAVSPVRACQVSAERLMGQLVQLPELAVELIRQLARKLQAAHQKAANLVFDDTRDRLIKALLEFSGTAAASPAEGGEGVGLRITHQQLAQAVGAARETVSLTLTQLRQQNLLRTGRNRLWFDPDALAKFAGRGQGERTAAPEGVQPAQQAADESQEMEAGETGISDSTSEM